jgi:hypothetical protein
MHTFLVFENDGGGEKYVLGSWIRVMEGLKGCVESKGDRMIMIIHVCTLHLYKTFFLLFLIYTFFQNIKCVP